MHRWHIAGKCAAIGPGKSGPYWRPKGWIDKPGETTVFPVIKVHEPGAIGHGFLLTKLVKVPANKAIKLAIPKIAKAATGGK